VTPGGAGYHHQRRCHYPPLSDPTSPPSRDTCFPAGPPIDWPSLRPPQRPAPAFRAARSAAGYPDPAQPPTARHCSCTPSLSLRHDLPHNTVIIPVAGFRGPTSAGNRLLRAVRPLATGAGVSHRSMLAVVTLVTLLAALAEAVAEPREVQPRAAQAASARRGLTPVHSPSRERQHGYPPDGGISRRGAPPGVEAVERLRFGQKLSGVASPA
jgi:hypothetical protein